ncbi:SCO family protein [Klenkia terrae]|jgi:protein SCO1/2|uniref:SCO family protein n=1 Tax=Klenkia terrae TaxID=1052259 RepID=A0ABU8E112_9ACTN|nr:SCO family protein [Klenkia terrae]SSC22620.1 Copper chaperone SCO1/SenC [Klenkia terrae]
MRSTHRSRTLLGAALLSASLLLAGCGTPASSPDTGATADGGGMAGMSMPPAPATLSAPDNPYEGLNLATPFQKPTFTLTDQSGAAYDFAARTGDAPTLLFFGYTNCPDVCPTTMADVAIALQTVDPAVAEQVQVVFVTTDPARDTPAVLGEYLGRFSSGAAAPFVGLTGTQSEIDAAQLEAGVPLAEEEGQQHSSLVLLYGDDGQAHVAFNAADGSSAIAHDLAVVAGS